MTGSTHESPLHTVPRRPGQDTARSRQEQEKLKNVSFIQLHRFTCSWQSDFSVARIAWDFRSFVAANTRRRSAGKTVRLGVASGRGWRNMVVRSTVFSAFMKRLQLRNTVFGSWLLKRLSRRLQKPNGEIPKHLTRHDWGLSSSKIAFARADTSQLLEGQVKRFQGVIPTFAVAELV